MTAYRVPRDNISKKQGDRAVLLISGTQYANMLFTNDKQDYGKNEERKSGGKLSLNQIVLRLSALNAVIFKLY